MKLLSLIFSCFFFLWACSENDATFDTDDAEVVTVKAYMMKLGDSANTRLKQDTLLPTDSIVFLANIEPSRSIRINDFYWQIDSSTTTHSEFSYRTNVSTPGKHRAKFILLDRFSDTLRDSVIFWIAPKPVLDLQNWIPKNGSSAISPAKALSFAWNVSAENPLAITKYPFLLKCGADTLADTVLTSPQFIYTKGFPALQRCSWTVFATDDFENSSAGKIQSEFFTGSDTAESLGSAYAIIYVPNNALQDSIQFNVFDSTGSLFPVEDYLFDWNESIFLMRNLPAANYSLALFHPLYPDYTSDTIPFSIQQGKVSYLGSIPLTDSTFPKIICAYCSRDSLEWEDTLKFVFDEKGLPIFSSSIHITFDGSILKEWTVNGDSLFIFTEKLSKSFVWHPITISFTDRAGNYTSQSFFVEPGNSCVETLTEASIYVDNSIAIPIRNVCSNLTPKRFFWDIDHDGNWDGEMAADGDFAFKLFSGSLFHLFANEIQVYILYESGAKYKASFTLYVDGVSG